MLNQVKGLIKDNLFENEIFRRYRRYRRRRRQ